MQQAIVRLEPDIGLSVLLGYILAPEFLSRFARGAVNLHLAYLPYNRGSNPNVWSIVERTPAGATLHWMDAGVDTGDIIAQATTDVAADDTGETHSYEKVLLATGGTPRRLPSGGDDEVIYYRTLDDYRRLRNMAGDGLRAAVISSRPPFGIEAVVASAFSEYDRASALMAGRALSSL